MTIYAKSMKTTVLFLLFNYFLNKKQEKVHVKNTVQINISFFFVTHYSESGIMHS